MKRCPTKNEYERLLDDQLAGDEELRLAAHLESCAICQQLLETLTAIDEASASRPSLTLRTLDACEQSTTANDTRTTQDEDSTPSEHRSVSCDAQDSERGASSHGLEALLPLLDPSKTDEHSETNDDHLQPTYAELEIPGYKILGELGRGGMGVVYKARDIRLNRLVAIKYLRAVGESSAEQRVRFRMEGETIASLNHPNIVQLYEVGTHCGRPFYVMELIKGGNLAERVGTTPQDACSVAELSETIARVIAYAHSQRVVHRDLKPGNILLTEENGSTDPFNRPRIADFGLARNLDASHLSLTDTGVLAGTPNYMAPEQIQGSTHQISPSTDIYSIGAIIYHLLTGRPPFLATSVLDTITQLANDEPISPRQLEPSIPRDLEVICLKCLRKDPQKRFATAQELADDLQRFRQGKPIQAKSTTSLERLWSLARRNPVTAGLTIAFLALLVFAAVGSTIYSKLLVEQLNRAEQAEVATSSANRKVMETLFNSYLEQARISRLSGRVGQRSKSLDALGQAAKLGKQLELGEPSRLLLRNEAIASLALADFRLAQSWKLPRPAGEGLGIDANSPRYAVCNLKNQIEIRSVVDNQLLKSIACSQPVQVLRFGPNNKYLAGVSWADARSKCYLWDLQSDELVFETTHEASELAIAFSPQSDRIAIGLWSGQIRIYDIPAGTYERVFSLRRNPNHIQFAPAGPLIAIANSVAPLVEIGSTETGEIVAELKHPAAVRQLSWSQDGSLIATGCDDNHIYIWDANSMELKSKLDGHHKNRIYLAFNSAANRLLSQSPDGTTRVWDPFSGEQLIRLDTRSIFQWCANDSHMAGAAAGVFERWEVLDQGELSAVYHGKIGNESPSSAANGLSNVDYHPYRDLLVSCGFDGVRFWDSKSKSQVAHLPLDANCTAGFHPDGGLITLSNGNLRYFQLPRLRDGQVKAPTPIALPLSADFGVSKLAFDQTGETFGVANLGDNVVVVGKVNSDERQIIDIYRPLDVALSPAGDSIAVATESQLLVRKLEGQQTILEVQGRFDCVAFHPTGDCLLAGNQSHYSLWNMNSPRRPSRILDRPKDNIHSGALAFSRCGRFLALAVNRRRIKLFDATMTHELAELHSHGTNLISHLRFHADSTQLAVANENHTVQFWDLELIDEQLSKLDLTWNRDFSVARSIEEIVSRDDDTKETALPVGALKLVAESHSITATETPVMSERYRPHPSADEVEEARKRWSVVNAMCQRDPSPANRLARGWLNAQLGEFDAAAADWAATIRPDSEENWDLFRRSILRLFRGDRVGHARDCRRILNACSDTTHPVVYERIALSIALADELTDLDRSILGEIKPFVEASALDSVSRSRLFPKATLLLRQGHYDQSKDVLQAIMHLSEKSSRPSPVQTKLCLALIQCHMNPADGAKTAQQYVTHAVEQLGRSIGGRAIESNDHWHDLLASLVLLRQIEQTMSDAQHAEVED